MLLSNLKTGRDESPSWVRIPPFSRPKFSPSQETTLSFIVEFRALRTVDPVRRYQVGTFVRAYPVLRIEFPVTSKKIPVPSK
jgi:hypothetical protein